ncbi:MAG TPA: electron transport complex subunit E [Spirochaetota bacterium]|nr:electron transport complex subunit E [Spirochaetota bacterium]HPI88112.1 electron transport complex subunit E [Spirochaetota bacterium]HPR46403.1 electron transport complex subunit E [Spirochaetota bacterium]
MNYWQEFVKGIWKKNPILILGIGMCPTLAVTTSVSNALWMTMATTMVLVCSNILVSLVKGFVPGHIRIPIFITIIATFVTVVELTLNAFQPAVYKALGIFIPLIVVNCIILGRAEEFASKNSIILSVFDGIGMGLGFGVTLFVLAFVREILGANKLFGLTLIPGMQPSSAMIIAPGAFFTLGLMLWGMNYINSRKKD